MKRPRIIMHCICGGRIELTFVVGTPAAKQQGAASRVFRSAHSGQGHALCDKRTADRAKLAAERAKGIYRFG